MDDIREKLIELLETVVSPKEVLCNGEVLVPMSRVADHLIANGVTLKSRDCHWATERAYKNGYEKGRQDATDNNVGCKWIPVAEGMPKLIPCDAGTAYSEAVNVLTTGRKVLTAIWDGFDWICDAEFWDAENEDITHWAPVPLPLPEPPAAQKEN